MGARKHTICTIEDCGKEHAARGYCINHYYAKYRSGEIAVKQRGRTHEERFWAKVDKSGDCWLWTASLRSGGYGQFIVNGKGNAYAHRFSYQIHYGPIPEGMHVDHMCGVRHCVNPEHLRLATPKQNSEHRTALSPNKTSRYRGVAWREKDRRWVAQVWSNGASHWAGAHSTEEAAALAAIALRNELFTHNIERDIPVA